VRSVIFTDIDETLIHSVRRRPPQEGDALAARDKHGNPTSFQSPSQAALLGLLQRADRVVAVTGRSVDAYLRVVLPLSSVAVVHHGAVILRAGEPDEAYAQAVEPALRASSSALEEGWGRIEGILADPSAGLRASRQRLDGRTIEVCVKSALPGATEVGPQAELIRRRWEALGADVIIHHNGNNLALLPAQVDKKRAVGWLMERFTEELGPISSVGVGDSLTDHGFMSLCDYYIIPDRSQLHRAFARQGADHECS
jgi:hydroxymethylpyrimidine pyrophosphatase-like HAD family hydrolase